MEFLPKNGLIHAYAFSTGGLKLTTAGDNKEANAMLNEVLEALQLPLVVEYTLDGEKTFDVVSLQEYIAKGQRKKRSQTKEE